MTKPHLVSGGRYPVLRVLGILFLIGALATLCYGLYKTGWAFFASPASAGERVELGLQYFAATFFAVVTIVAFAELIKLMIDIEHNTRIAAHRGATADTMTTVLSGGDGHTNRLSALDEESAEAALLRGH